MCTRVLRAREILTKCREEASVTQLKAVRSHELAWTLPTPGAGRLSFLKQGVSRLAPWMGSPFENNPNPSEQDDARVRSKRRSLDPRSTEPFGPRLPGTDLNGRRCAVGRTGATDVQVLASCVRWTRGRWWRSNQGQRNIGRGSAGQSPWPGTRHAPRKFAQPSKARSTEPAPWWLGGWGHPGRGRFVGSGVSGVGYRVLRRITRIWLASQIKVNLIKAGRPASGKDPLVATAPAPAGTRKVRFMAFAR